MGAQTEAKKKVVVFDPAGRSRTLLGKLLIQMGYQVELRDNTAGFPPEDSGADLLILNLAGLGKRYQDIVAALQKMGLAGRTQPPLLALTTLALSEEARSRLADLGVRNLLAHDAPWMELLFAINRLLFPKIRELRRYTRVFGGFPVQFKGAADWCQGEVYNLSQEGAFIQCDLPPPEGSRLQVRFSLPGTDSSIEVSALVNWINDPSGGPTAPPGIGVNFLTLDAQGADSLARFIAGRINGSDPSP